MSANRYIDTRTSAAFIFPEIVIQHQSLPELYDALSCVDNVEQRFDVLLRHLPMLLEQSNTLDATDRTSWLVLLRDVFLRDFSISTDNLCLTVDLLIIWSDWLLACYLGELLVEQRNTTIDRLRLMYCYWMTGETDIAIDHGNYLLKQESENNDVINMLAQFHQWQKYYKSILGVTESFAQNDSNLKLVLLGQHHCHDFAWQYYDPKIAEQCCSHTFESNEDWLQWLHAEQSLNDQVNFAVIHADYGFIGTVNLVLHNGVGFCYYWIGKDFRKYGMGSAAVALLLDTAKQEWGMHTCYAKAFADNVSSRRLLDKLGFIYIKSAPDNNNIEEVFYRLSEYNLGKQDIDIELRTLQEAMKTEVETCNQ